MALRYRDRVTDPRIGLAVAATVFQWLVPIPGQDRTAVLSFVSPETEPDLSQAFAELFAAIADSFSFLAPEAAPEPAVGTASCRTQPPEQAPSHALH